MSVSSTRMAASITVRSGNQAHGSTIRGRARSARGDVFCLAGQGVDQEARRLGDEVGVKRLQLGLFGLAMRVAKLGPLRHPQYGTRWIHR